MPVLRMQWDARVRVGLATLFAVAVCSADLVAFHGASGGFNWAPVRSDGEGYFAYLPVVLLHGSLDFNVLAGHFGGPPPRWAGFFVDPGTGRTADIYVLFLDLVSEAVVWFNAVGPNPRCYELEVG